MTDDEFTALHERLVLDAQAPFTRDLRITPAGRAWQCDELAYRAECARRHMTNSDLDVMLRKRYQPREGRGGS